MNTFFSGHINGLELKHMSQGYGASITASYCKISILSILSSHPLLFSVVIVKSRFTSANSWMTIF